MIESDLTPQEWLLHEGDADAVLAVAAEAVSFSREADRLRVRTVLRWAELHPAAGEDAACWGQLDGSDCEVPVNRVGCPGVSASSVADLAAALQMTTAAALYLLDDCLELRFRLPGIHARFERLEVDLARVRLVTRLTERLGPEAAGFVDTQLARRIGRIGRRTIEAAVALAIARFHPELADEKARGGKAGWHVEVQHPDQVDFASTSRLDASADSLDLEDFMAALGMVAEDLARDGDPDTHGQRLAKSLGIIGRAMTGRGDHPGPEQRPEPSRDDDRGDDDASQGEPAHHDDEQLPAEVDARLQEGPGSPPAGDPLANVPRPRSPQRRRRAGITVHAHLHTDPVTHTSTTIYQLPGLGVVAEEAFGRWQATHGVKVTRVIDLNQRHRAVDRHDPPPTIRDQVRERDQHCVFPGCEVPATSCDADHIVPYDPHGPPGQTNPDALACLCRMHHLFKTHHGWRYGRLSDHSYLWVSPTGRTYQVGPDGGTTWDQQVTA